MSGNLWMFSDMLDDEDIEMLKRDFVTYYQASQQEIGGDTVKVSHILKLIYRGRFPFAFPDTKDRLGNIKLFSGLCDF